MGLRAFGRGWVIALAIPATAVPCACSLGFDTFNPVATTAGDSGLADTGNGGFDTGTTGGDSGSSGGDTGTPADTGTTMEAGCAGLQSCLTTGGNCGMGCGTTYQQCVSMCGGMSCRQMCRNQQTQCRSTCASHCTTCTTAAGCTDNADCQTASMM